MRAAARSLPHEHAAALLAVAVLHIHQRPGGNAKLCVAAKELLLAHGAAFEQNEGVPTALTSSSRWIWARKTSREKQLGTV